jgi:hypothetical protein|tara:strand:- start:615 stop:866 length:252 start_codon:yes stop_codon:yes gene_type:complete
MVETLFILILYMKGVPLEYMGHHDVRGQWKEMGMAGCLSMKRTLKRNGWRDTEGSGTRYSCERRQVLVETGSDGRHRVMKIIE